MLNGCDSRPYLLHVNELDKPANKANVMQTIQDALGILWLTGILYDNVRLLVSGQAKYLLKASRLFREDLFPNMLDVTCLCHQLQRVREAIRLDYPKANLLVSSFLAVI